MTIAFIMTLCFETFSQVNDSIEIVTLLKNDYMTLENMDSKTHRENCTSDYLLIEDGEIWDIDKEIEILFNPKEIIKIYRQNEFIFKMITVDKPYAYAVYELKSEITKNGVLKKYRWTESALFYYVSGKWKIKLIHSTKLND